MSEKKHHHARDDLDEMLDEIAQNPAARAAYMDAIRREGRTTKASLGSIKIEWKFDFFALPYSYASSLTYRF